VDSVLFKDVIKPSQIKYMSLVETTIKLMCVGLCIIVIVEE